MHTTLSSKWHLPALFMAVFLLAGCGVTTKKTFLGEPVQKRADNAVPVSSGEPGQISPDGLSRNPALDSAPATGVQRLFNIITPYRINIQQGNFVSQEMLARIQPGMTKEQVRFALGTPLLLDVFHSARWNYIFRLQKTSGQITNNRVIIHFEDNHVVRIVNDPLPDETQYLESIAGPAPKKKVADSDIKTVAATDEKDAARQADTPVSGKASSVTDSPEVTIGKTETTPASTEAVEAAPEPRAKYRSEPIVTDTHEATPPRTETVEATPVETVLQEREPVSAGTTETAPAAMEVEPVYTDTPQPVRQEKTKKAATTSQDVSDEQDDDFRAAPNSTMQLHQLMQPQ